MCLLRTLAVNRSRCTVCKQRASLHCEPSCAFSDDHLWWLSSRTGCKQKASLHCATTSFLPQKSSSTFFGASEALFFVTKLPPDHNDDYNDDDEKQEGEDNHVVMKFVPVLNTLSLFADEAGTVKTFFATLDRIGKTTSWSFHQPSTLDALCARLKFSYWIISLLIGGIPAGSRRCRRPPSSSSTPPQSILLSLQVCHFLPS